MRYTNPRLYFTLQSFLSVLQKSPSVLEVDMSCTWRRLYVYVQIPLDRPKKPASKPGLRPGFRQVADISVPKLIADKSYTTRRDRQQVRQVSDFLADRVLHYVPNSNPPDVW